MFPEADLLPLSALQHLLFCERQCALIHVEQSWIENRFTAEGRVVHEKVHSAGHETREGVRIVRDLSLRSLRLGLVGKADVVEFHGKTPFPVEHKRGRQKANDCDRVQLCAQAICLEEMLGVSILEGAIFYGQPRRREHVELDATLRDKTQVAAQRLHELFKAGVTPPACYEKSKCDHCSLLEICKPKLRHDVHRYIQENAQ